MKKQVVARTFKQASVHTKEIITDNDAANQVLEMDKFIGELTASKKKTNTFLSSTGMFNVDGKLKKAYQ